MKIAVQQPYFYPYLGFFNLIKEVDVFVLFNDVQYIRRGWINRNRLEEKLFLTVPVKNNSRNSLINQIKIDNEQKWHYKHCQTILSRYGKRAKDHPLYLFYKDLPKIEFLLDLLKITIDNVCNYLQIKTKIVNSETFHTPVYYKGKERIIDICKKINADSYLNLPGGASLYSVEEFKEKNISLNFLNISNIKNYMSILDVCIGDGINCV